VSESVTEHRLSTLEACLETLCSGLEAVGRAVEGPARPEWLTTPEAAHVLQVDRSVLDRLAPRAVEVSPEGAVRVGQGSERKTYRWHRDLLPLTLKKARGPDPEPARPTPRRRAPAKRRKGSKLRSLVD